jgi:hypothetical protein
MSLTERLIDLTIWWGALALAATALWVASQQTKNDPAPPLEGQREAANETITTRETA